MARGKKKLTIELSPIAINHLRQIHAYNVEHRSESWADRYLAFLEKSIFSLSSNFDKGRSIEGFPDLSYQTFRMRNRGDGHIVVYKVKGDKVSILQIFHTKQDWQNKL